MRLPDPKLLASRKVLSSFGNGALITTNSKISEVGKSRISCIKERFREHKTLST